MTQPQNLLVELFVEELPPKALKKLGQAFAGVRPVARHQRVYAVTQTEMATGLHALALHTYTPEEWAATGQAPDSPACRGGSRHG